MSLSKLPDEQIAHIASFLNIPSMFQFAQTNYRTYKVIKKFKADKSFTVRQLNIQHMWDETTPTMEFEVSGIYLNGISFTLPRIVATAANGYFYEKELYSLLNKFRSIEYLKLSDFFMEPLVYNVLLASEAKVEFLSLNSTTIRISLDQITMLFSKYQRVHLFDCWVPEKFLTDEVFCTVISKTELTLNSCKRIARLGVSDLTDKSLEVLGTNPLKNEFTLVNMRSNFTIQGIRQLVEKVFSQDNFNIYWDLGILANAQLVPAFNFADEANTDPDCPYYIKNFGGGNYLILPKKNNPYRQLNICFEIAELLG